MTGKTGNSQGTRKGRERKRKAALGAGKKVAPIMKDTGLDLAAAVGGAVTGAILPGWAGGLGGLGLIVASNAVDGAKNPRTASAMRTAGATMLTSVSVSAIGGASQRTDGKEPTIFDKAKAQAKSIAEKFRIDKLFRKAPEDGGEAASLGYAGNAAPDALDAITRQLEAAALDFQQSGMLPASGTAIDASY